MCCLRNISPDGLPLVLLPLVPLLLVLLPLLLLRGTAGLYCMPHRA